MKSAIGAQDWTPRHNFSKPGRPAAATGGLWALGSPESLVDRIKAMAEGDFLVVATDGALVKVMENTTGGWKSVPHMGGGWVIGIALKGTNVELAGVGRVEWVAAGAVRVQLTSACTFAERVFRKLAESNIFFNYYTSMYLTYGTLMFRYPIDQLVLVVEIWNVKANFQKLNRLSRKTALISRKSMMKAGK